MKFILAQASYKYNRYNMLRKIIIVSLWLLLGYLSFWKELTYIFYGSVRYLWMNGLVINAILRYILLSLLLIIYTYSIRKKYNYKFLDIIIYVFIGIVGLSLLNKWDNPSRIQTIWVTNKTLEAKEILVDGIYFADEKLDYLLGPWEKIQFRILSSPVTEVDKNTLYVRTVSNWIMNTLYKSKLEELFKWNSLETELFIEK